jgi:hypothetical protein
MSYGVILWGNSFHGIQIFWMQKRVIIIITGCGNTDSCRILFKKLNFFSTYVTIYSFPTYNCSEQQGLLI